MPSTADSRLPNAIGLNSALSTFPIATYISPEGSESLFEHQLRAVIGPSLTMQHLKDAVSLKDKPLFQNYKNWLAMARLLDAEVSSLPGPIGAVTTAKFSTDETAEILRHFNWAPTSYYKKRRLFLWAYSAAFMLWNGPTGSTFLYVLCFLFF